jgi:hypothetical protein
MKRERRKLTARELQTITTPGLVRRVVRPEPAKPPRTDEEVPLDLPERDDFRKGKS